MHYNSPYGTIAVLYDSGAFTGYGVPGFQSAGPFAQVAYLVSKQDFVYESPDNRVTTRDNLPIQISISLLLKIQEEHDYVQQLVTNVPQINETIDANIMERVRTLARSVKASEAYSLRGDENAKGMLEYLNTNLNNKGIFVKRAIIKSVKLDAEVANSMQEKTIYQFKNTLERKKFAFEQRIKNDKEETEKIKQFKEEERKDVSEQAILSQLKKEKEIEGVKAKTQRTKAEYEAKTEALINSIDADTDLKYNEIIAEAKLIETQIKEEAAAEAAKMIAEADAYKATTIANAQKEVAGQIAEAVKLEGNAESKLQKAFAAKRVHDEIMQKIDAVNAFAHNSQSVIFGDQKNNLLAQVETYNMVRK